MKRFKCKEVLIWKKLGTRTIVDLYDVCKEHGSYPIEVASSMLFTLGGASTRNTIANVMRRGLSPGPEYL